MASRGRTDSGQGATADKDPRRSGSDSEKVRGLDASWTQSGEQGAIRRACGVTQFGAAQGHGQVDDALHEAMPSTTPAEGVRNETSSKWCSDGAVLMTQVSSRGNRRWRITRYPQ
ncbi:hypothetical protein PG5_47890 [Pseudomonas sp. G5(2012)]|nr:hypothetical protein PG5_47890 [Pseudomonas sp. G5(2012)]